MSIAEIDVTEIQEPAPDDLLRIVTTGQRSEGAI